MRILTLIPALCTLLPAQEMSKGFEHFYNLEYGEAIREFQAEVTRRASDAAAHNHLAQAVLYREMYRSGALESDVVGSGNSFLQREPVTMTADALQTFETSIAKALSLAQSAVDRNPRDTGALYALGVAYGLRANYHFLVEKAWIASLKDAAAARKAHNQAAEVDPRFVDARLVQGLHDYIVGSLPWHLKLITTVVGVRGDREEGIATLKQVAAQGRAAKYDAQALLAAIYRREKRPLEALPLLNRLTERFPRNYLFRLEAVQMYGDAGDKAGALAALAKAEQLKQSGAGGYEGLPLAKIYYTRGNLYFWYRDFDAAIDQFRRVTPGASSVDPRTAALTWLRLGQSLDMKQRREEAVRAYQQVHAVAPDSDAARQAREFARSPYRHKV